MNTIPVEKRFCWPQPGELWRLRDMIELEWRLLQNALHELASIRQVLLVHDKTKSMACGEKGVDDIEKAVLFLHALCLEQGLDAAAEHAEWILNLFRQHRSATGLPVHP